jgi:hypothetical protein
MLLTAEQAFKQQLRNIFLSVEGIVAEVMPDDITGVKHQRFIILTSTGQTILIVYNIDNNPKIDIRVGQKIHAEGTYMWNKYGGLLHETHAKVNKSHPDGKIVIK